MEKQIIRPHSASIHHFVVVLVLCFGVMVAIGCKNTQLSPQVTERLHPTIQRMLADRELSLAELIERRFEPEGYKLETVVEKDADRTMSYYLKEPDDSYIFVDGELLTITHIFWTARDSVAQYSFNGILKILGKPEANLGSTDGFGFGNCVYQNKGICICGNMPGDYYETVTVFPSMNLHKFKKRIWRDPKEYAKDRI
jgi:hypothetical protein